MLIVPIEQPTLKFFNKNSFEINCKKQIVFYNLQDSTEAQLLDSESNILYIRR